MKKAEKLVVGTWRITGMEVWDADYFYFVTFHSKATEFRR